MANLWTSAEHALSYLAQADNVPHRTEGEAVLLEEIPKTVKRILDLGTGDGRLLALLKLERPTVSSVAIDFSPTMLEAVKNRFQDDSTVEIINHNLDETLPEFDSFDAIISSFAIHHLSHNRKRSLYVEIFNLLQPGGIFCNLEHVASPTVRLHEKFLKAMGITPADEDPSNQLLDMETQLKWLRNTGFEDVESYWKWLELALQIGLKPKF
ncbi:MAG: class I SAM-dependent methyltransferase [Rivularia sp. ALOHA_DT_140]|nr:class I SAM-dependent methyltransferase [Rivularia sp. ALOHA_DT_140]